MDRSRASGLELGPMQLGQIDPAAFERLLASVSIRFACLKPEQVVDAVRETIEEIRDLFGYDRATYSEFPGPNVIEVLCSASAPGTALLPVGRVEDDMRWLRGELLAGRVIALPDLPHGLPPEATVETERCRLQGVRSHLSIPLRVGERVVGALSFAGLERRPSWPPEAIRRLVIVGELMATAIDRVRIEHESRALRERLWHADRVARTSALASAFAHELNQPIAAILSNAQSELRYAESGRSTSTSMREVLEAIVRDVHRASDTIRAVRRLLRRDEGAREPVDVGDALREVVQLLHSELVQRRIRVELRVAADVRVPGNRPQLQQVAFNLVQNAMQAMADVPADDRLLRIDVGEDADGRARIRVQDSGPGVPPSSAGSIFEPLWTSRPDGLGFGLAICRAIVESHGGTIELAPSSSGGATFDIDLPTIDVGAKRGSAAAAIVLAPGEPTARHDARFVAVVDDDAALRSGVERLLESEGFRVRTWADGRTLLDDAALDDAACVLLDVRMPGLSGPEVHRALRERGLAMPVIYLTADDDVLDGVGAMKRGAADFLLKPVPADVLITAVRSALERDAATRERSRELDARRARYDRLTGRERDVMHEVLRGRLNKQIAVDLGISEPTVKQHRARVMEKMEVRSVAELIRACEAIVPPRPARPAR